jgi:hypothetical protein
MGIHVHKFFERFVQMNTDTSMITPIGNCLKDMMTPNATDKQVLLDMARDPSTCAGMEAQRQVPLIVLVLLLEVC